MLLHPTDTPFLGSIQNYDWQTSFTNSTALPASNAVSGGNLPLI